MICLVLCKAKDKQKEKKKNFNFFFWSNLSKVKRVIFCLTTTYWPPSLSLLQRIKNIQRDGLHAHLYKFHTHFKTNKTKMLDLEIIPERSLRCENCWEFILGKYKARIYCIIYFIFDWPMNRRGRRHRKCRTLTDSNWHTDS